MEDMNTSYDVNEIPEQMIGDDDIFEEVDIFEEISLDDELQEPSIHRRKAEEEPFNLLKEVANTFFFILIVLALSYLMVTYVVQRTEVEGSSMMLTLEDKDSVFIDKLSYRFTDPDRYDIVVFNYMYKVDTHYIKRIIALPGETVQIIDGYVYVDKNDGQGMVALSDDVYGKEVIAGGNYGLASQTLTLGEDEYFVLGDNRNDSHDSRRSDVGMIDKDQIIGKAFVRIWPLNEIKLLSH